jgi:hypothetical protein
MKVHFVWCSTLMRLADHPCRAEKTKTVARWKCVHLDSSPESQLAWSAAFTPLPHRKPAVQLFLSLPSDVEAA